MTLLLLGRTTGIFSNKYPPSLYFSAYNMTMIMLLVGMGRKLIKAAKENRIFKSVIRFLSLATYEIFFYHLLVMKVLRMKDFKVNILVDYIVLMSITLGFVYLKQTTTNWFKNLRSSD